MSFSKRPLRPAAALLLALAAVLSPTAARADSLAGVKVSVLHAAYYPSGLTVGPDGALYGTDDLYNGDIFKVTLGGLYHRLFTFNVADGYGSSLGPLLILPNGSFFGSAPQGGKSNTGTLFQFTAPNRFQLKHQFAATDTGSGNYQTNTRGAYPVQPMALGPDGAMYGVTGSGGSTGNGVLFRYTAAHGVEVLHNFASNENASMGGIALGPDGALYGTTFTGGASGDGEIFRVTTAGAYSILHTFSGADGSEPLVAPVTGPDGALYGTTLNGGVNNSDGGTAYRITTGGAFTLLHSFSDASGVGHPVSAFAVGPDGKLYGTAIDSDRQYQGAVYRMTTTGSVTLLYAPADNDNPINFTGASPVFAHDNRLYVCSDLAIYRVTVPF